MKSPAASANVCSFAAAAAANTVLFLRKMGSKFLGRFQSEPRNRRTPLAGGTSRTID